MNQFSREVTSLHIDTAPHNVEAEQQLLGAMLINPQGLSRLVSDAVTSGGADLFYDPVHARIFTEIVAKDRSGNLVSPVTLRETFKADHGLAELGGPAYLARMAGAAISAFAATSYVELLADLRRKRDLIAVISDAQGAIARGEDSADLVASRLEAALMAVQPVGATRPVSMLAASTDALEMAYKAYQGDDSGAVKSGLPALDKIVPGFFPGEMILLGGRPSMGKTAVALSFALNAARAEYGVCIASLEMTPASMAQRALSEATVTLGNPVSYKQMRTGNMTEREMRTVADAAKVIEALPIQFLPASYRDIGALMAGVKQAKAKMGGNLRLVIVDYLQLLRGTGRGRYEEITEISIALKALAMQLSVPVLALSQLSRAVESRDEKRPVLSDLRESGQLEQDADAVMFCYRDEYYLERERPKDDDLEGYTKWFSAIDAQRNRLEVIVVKQRQGEIGTAHMMFNAATNAIWEDGTRT